MVIPKETGARIVFSFMCSFIQKGTLNARSSGSPIQNQVIGEQIGWLVENLKKMKKINWSVILWKLFMVGFFFYHFIDYQFIAVDLKDITRSGFTAVIWFLFILMQIISERFDKTEKDEH